MYDKVCNIKANSCLLNSHHVHVERMRQIKYIFYSAWLISWSLKYVHTTKAMEDMETLIYSVIWISKYCSKMMQCSYGNSNF